MAFPLALTSQNARSGYERPQEEHLLIQSGSKIQTGTSGIAGAIFNLMNAVCGVGMLGLPYALHRAGFVFGVILLLAVALVTDFTMRLIVMSALSVGVTTYEGLCYRAFGRSGFYVICFMITLTSVGYSIGFLVLGDNLSAEMRFLLGEDHWFADRRILVGISSTFFILPLSCCREMGMLRHVSLLSFCCVIYTIIAIAVEGMRTTKQIDFETAITIIEPTFLSSLGGMAYAFVTHQTVFLIYESLKKPSLSAWNFVTHVSMANLTVAYLTTAIFGYLAFTSNTKGNVLENFPDDSIPIIIARMIIALTMVLSYPIYLVAGRYILHAVFCRKSMEISLPATNCEHISLTLFFWGSTTAVSCFVDDFGVVVGLVGSSAAVCAGYLMPILCYFKIFGFMELAREVVDCWKMDSEVYRRFIGERIILAVSFISCVLILVLVVFVFFVGTIMTFM